MTPDAPTYLRAGPWLHPLPERPLLVRLLRKLLLGCGRSTIETARKLSIKAYRNWRSHLPSSTAGV